jgi:hypothetical protein
MRRSAFFLISWLTMSAGPPAIAADDLMPPTRLTANGDVIDTGPMWGHSSPCMEDMNGDGRKDLLLGDFGGKFRIYKNVGSDGEPAFEDEGLLQAGGEPASVHIYCCIGAQARFVDIDGDGRRDLISNSYDPGHCYLFRSLPDGGFAKGEELLDKAGVPVRSAPVQEQNYQSFGSFYAPVDWEADGDVDLLIGCFDGNLKLRVNEGDPQKFSFSDQNVPVTVGEEPLRV